MNYAEAKLAVLQAIATAQGKTVDELAHDAPDQPDGLADLDSIALIEALAILEATTGIKVPSDKDTCKALRSVDSLIAYISQLASATTSIDA